MKLSAKIFLENGEEFVFGPGRLELLKAVKELGSLRKAAQQLGMSYRWAWGRLNNAERDLQISLLTRTDAPIGGRPKVLTAEAHALLEWFEAVEANMQKALEKANATMPAFLANVSAVPAPDEKSSKAGKKRSRVALD